MLSVSVLEERDLCSGFKYSLVFATEMGHKQLTM